ncbi:hypothetical protein Srubr_19960 [Streptomyces rubradiris]|uniref:Uncharacterized protein n=1 Tax=Streptomyces rubradiris TaxID=285531 RepID=A0ABQ3R8G9_STRRR|nr:hypothetical protein GCM10018792_59700 [Streptomyces rubradiris]GHI52150.1 hypothetical protein Srubr_19960 [Streptomyces rubradiris]
MRRLQAEGRNRRSPAAGEQKTPASERGRYERAPGPRYLPGHGSTLSGMPVVMSLHQEQQAVPERKAGGWSSRFRR